MVHWLCVEGCGACCHLAPEDRPDLPTYLSPEELTQYHAMVGEGGWCVHYDRHQRKCTIYDDRPRFCRVTPDNFHRMFQVPPEEFTEFAIDCCCQQIEGVYGEESEELDRYLAAVNPMEGD